METAEQLCGSILGHLSSHFVQVPDPAAAVRLLPTTLHLCHSNRWMRADNRWMRFFPVATPLQDEELVGTKEDGTSARCIVREVEHPQRAAAAPGAHENGATGPSIPAAAGEDSEATEDEKEGGKEDEEEEDEEAEQPPVDPESIIYVVEWLGEGGTPTAERASLCRTQLQRPEDSPLAALTQPLLQQWVETVATAEPVAVGGPGELRLHG